MGKSKVKREKLKFVSHGHRRFNRSGLYYMSECGGYALYKSDQLHGQAVEPVRWIAFMVTGVVYRIISRHLSRKPAERACQKFDNKHNG